MSDIQTITIRDNLGQAIGTADIDLTDYIRREEISENYLTTEGLDNLYAKKTDLPDMTQYINISNAGNLGQYLDLSGYLTEASLATWLANNGYSPGGGSADTSELADDIADIQRDLATIKSQYLTNTSLTTALANYATTAQMQAYVQNNASGVEVVTQAYYNALSTSQKRNGKIYVISDATPSAAVQLTAEEATVMCVMTQEQYNEMSEPEPNTLYLISDSPDLVAVNLYDSDTQAMVDVIENYLNSRS